MKTHMVSGSAAEKLLRFLLAMAGVVFLLGGVQATTAQAASQFNLAGPAGSGMFGAALLALPNGNLVVADPGYTPASTARIGAVYLYNGATHALISTLTGSQTDDLAGVSLVPLSNGNFLVSAPDWSSHTGAVTWCSAATGCSGTISATNSATGGKPGDIVAAVVLANSDYVITDPNWTNGSAGNAGAVRLCLGSTGCSGSFSTGNSLVGSQAGDSVGIDGIVDLGSGAYLVKSSSWANGGTTVAGAVTWCAAVSGCTGPVTTTNSLVGSHAFDNVGSGEVAVLSSGNYVVASPQWVNSTATGAGAVTWCSKTGGCTGPVSTSNSLVGSQANDLVGVIGVVELSNGNYVVPSFNWANLSAAGAGAVTWCSGTAGCTGAVTASNSLVGSQAGDSVSGDGIVTLGNGNYVVRSSSWANGGTPGVGAVTWCSGTGGCTGPISAGNSLVGSQANDSVGGGNVAALSNNNYVVADPYWANLSAANAGAVTWCNGVTGCTGTISPTTSLVGSQVNDSIGLNGVAALSNGNFVVSSPLWDNSSVADVGAVTWCSGVSGCTGPVSASNSLVGSQLGDEVGSGGITALSSGNYVAASPVWNDVAVAHAGAVTWCQGTTGCAGPVSSSNSLAGSQTNDGVGSNGILNLSNGNFVVRSSSWSNGALASAGAVTWCRSTGGCTGLVSATNSLVGATAQDQVGSSAGGMAFLALSNGNYVFSSAYQAPAGGAVTLAYGSAPVPHGPVGSSNSVISSVSPLTVFTYDAANAQLIVGRPNENIVSFYKASFTASYLPLIKR